MRPAGRQGNRGRLTDQRSSNSTVSHSAGQSCLLLLLWLRYVTECVFYHFMVSVQGVREKWKQNGEEHDKWRELMFFFCGLVQHRLAKWLHEHVTR